MNNIRRYTAISGIVDVVYAVDDRVAFDFATFDNKIIAIAIKQRAYRYITINSRVVSYIMPTLNDNGQRSLPSQILYPPRLVVG